MNAETIPSGQLAYLLRDAAAGMLADMAAVDLICRHGRFLGDPAFRRIIAAWRTPRSSRSMRSRRSRPWNEPRRCCR